MQLEDNSIALEELEQKLSQAEAHYNRLQELQRAALDDRNNLNEERVKFESMVDQALNRLSEQYSMTIDEARQQMSDLDKETLATRLKLLKRDWMILVKLMLERLKNMSVFVNGTIS